MPEQMGSWLKERDIGSGGFGTVTLWTNVETAERIAVKQCRWGDPGTGTEHLLSPKVRDRWQKEVEIMLKLDHRGIVRCMSLPAAFRAAPSALPRLCMEYCMGGDLRRVLLRADNCCGLPELEVRRFLSDVTDAVGYLHGLRIIHRDLKPENVVLQLEDGRNVYKLIDLGYAKELDQSSVCTSFVGTLQYLAPELFLTNKYTCTADYWSLGLVAHEVIAGVRPFLPNMLPAKWMQEVSKKGANDICAEELDDGTIAFRSEIVGCTQVCAPLRQHLELWLRKLLDWEPRRRGRSAENSEVVVFSQLQDVLARKVVAIFCVPLCHLLHMEITDSTTMAEVQGFISSRTGLPAQRQELRLPRGNAPNTDPHQPALQCWAPPQEETDWLLYVYDASAPSGGAGGSPSHVDLPKMELPPLVREMFKDTEHRPPYYHQRAIYAQSVFLIREQTRLLNLLQKAQHVHMLGLAGAMARLRRQGERMQRELSRLQAASELFETSLSCDDELYCRQAETGGVTSARVYATWRQAGHQVRKRHAACHQRCTQLEASVGELIRRGTDLQRVVSPGGRGTVAAMAAGETPGATAAAADGFSQFYEKACEVYEWHRRRPKEQRSRRSANAEMIRIVVKFLKNREPPLVEVYQMLSRQQECGQEVETLSRPVAETIDQLQSSMELLCRYQQQRQTEIWKFMDLVLRSASPLPPPPPATDPPPPASHQPSPAAGNTVSAVLSSADGAAATGALWRPPTAAGTAASMLGAQSALVGLGVAAVAADSAGNAASEKGQQPDVLMLSQLLDSSTLETSSTVAENLDLHKQVNGMLESTRDIPAQEDDAVDWAFLNH